MITRELNRFAFPHRSFQEYLAMGWLTAQTEDRLSPEVCADPIWWREVFLFAVIEQKNNPRFATNYIRDVLDCGKLHQDSNRQRLFILSGLAVMELNSKGTDELTQTVRQGLIDLLEDSTALNVSERAEAVRVLVRIEDIRKGVGLNDQGWPDIDWIKIPPGEVVLEENALIFQVKSLYLARFPVTNTQFQCFIDDPEGYTNPHWWAALDEKPDTPRRSIWNEANHPRVLVSWFEAMAFCAWLSDRLGYAIHLPAEWQWQQAACSGQARFKYPWGPDAWGDDEYGHANIDEKWDHNHSTFSLRTSAVGIYPQGNSFSGSHAPALIVIHNLR